MTTTSTTNALRSLAKQAAFLFEKHANGQIIYDSYNRRRVTMFQLLAELGIQVLAEEKTPPLREIVVSGAKCDCKEKADA